MRNLSFFSRIAALTGVAVVASFSPVRAQTPPEVTPKTITGAPVEPFVEPLENDVPDDEAVETNQVEANAPEVPQRYTKPLPLPEESDENGRRRPNETQREMQPPRIENGQRRQQREERETGLRRLMVSFGVDERDAQNEVLEFIASETRARSQVRRQSNTLVEIMNTRNATDEQIATALQAYRDALKSERERRLQSEEALNDRLDFRNQPRLEAFLTLSGLIGDGPLSLPLNTRRPPNWEQPRNRTENRAYANKRPKDKIAPPQDNR